MSWWLGLIVGCATAGGIIALGLAYTAAMERRGRGAHGRPVPPTGVPLERREDREA